jgi:hypothetical protein
VQIISRNQPYKKLNNKKNILRAWERQTKEEQKKNTNDNNKKQGSNTNHKS